MGITGEQLVCTDKYLKIKRYNPGSLHKTNVMYVQTTTITVVLWLQITVSKLLIFETCDICCNAKLHLNRAKAARDAYRKDTGRSSFVTIRTETCVFCADMQKIILLPKLTTKHTVTVYVFL